MSSQKGTVIVEGEPDLNKLSKKERRKLKVVEKGVPSNDINNKVLVVKEKKIPIQKAEEVKTQVEKVSSAVSAPSTATTATPEGEKSKSQLRNERREKQEQQRNAKKSAKETKENKPIIAKPLKKGDDATIKSNDAKPKTLRKVVAVVSSANKRHRVQLFNHLEQNQFKPLAVYNDVHPAIIQLGAQYAAKTIIGSNARCLALLAVLKQLISDFQTPHNQELCRAFEVHLNKQLEHLQSCRPHAVSMANALRHFKVRLTHMDSKKDDLQDWIDSYVEDEMGKAAVAISQKVCEKITNNDVILTYGHSSLVNKILIDAKKSEKTFKVIVVDARPMLEGRQTLAKLTKAGIECTYILISATNFIIKRATKVIIGAHALLNNGYVMARAGTALVSLIAKTHMKPVLVCCETSKFSERAQTDSFVYNEIGDPNEVMPIKDKLGILNALNLMYDVTPPKYITGVATELGILPCTSVPVILRLKPTE